MPNCLGNGNTEQNTCVCMGILTNGTAVPFICSLGGVCDKTKASCSLKNCTANTNFTTCQCGTNVCNVGMTCVASTNTCAYPACTTAINLLPCLCKAQSITFTQGVCGPSTFCDTTITDPLVANPQLCNPPSCLVLQTTVSGTAVANPNNLPSTVRCAPNQTQCLCNI